MSNQQTEIDHARTLLEQHRANLRQLRQHQATYGDGEARLSLLNQIDHELEEIRRAKAILRQLLEEPGQAIGDPPETLVPFAQRLLTEYPEPIAQACAQFNQASNEREEFIALDRLLVHLTKYLAAIFIGQSRLDRLADYPLPQSLEWMAYPELEDWTTAIQRLSQLYQQPPHRTKWRLPGLLTACTRQLLDRAELLDVIDYLTRQLNRKGLDEPSVIDLLQLFASYRDKEWQDAPGDYDREQMNALLLRFQPALVILLNELATLRDYPLLYVEWTDLTDHAIRIRVVKFMGRETEELTPARKPPLTLAVADDLFIKPERLYIGNSAGQPLLPLHPFFIIHRWESYVLAQHQPTEFIEFRSCRGGRRFRPPAEAKTYYLLWIRDEGPSASVTDVPPILGKKEIVLHNANFESASQSEET